MRALVISLSVLLGLVACKPPSRGPAAVVQASDGQGDTQATLKRYWAVPAFELTTQDGKPFNAAQMLGKVWVVDFFYTTCPGPCPALTSRLSEIHQAFQGNPRVGFLSVSSDPEKDRPEILKKYAERFKADDRWTFLTGKKETVFSLANNGFKLSLTSNEGSSEPVTHSTRLVLVDSSGWVRGFFEGVGEDGQTGSLRLIEGIKTLLEEQK